MADICDDNRFEIIAKAKKALLEGTNIDMCADEMAVIDNILFRCWQMGWLDRYDTADTPQTDLLVKTPHKSRVSHENKCETCRDKDAYDEWQGSCDECENGSMYTPQTETHDLRTDTHECVKPERSK
jgi:hypothetical protein